jgi:hypothetical protein
MVYIEDKKKSTEFHLLGVETHYFSYASQNASVPVHIPLGRVGNKTKEVTIGVAMPGCVFHNNPIPVEYAKVLVHEVIDKACIDYPLDHVTPEGIKKLGEVVSLFILWNRHEIVLDGLTMPLI